MYRIDSEINKRKQSKLWSEDIAQKVLSEKSRRARRKLTVVGSFCIVFFVLFVIGFNVSRVGTESPYWVDDFISSVTDDSYYQSQVQEDLYYFVTYSFNGQ
jgi:hypothetical protein